MSRTNKITKRDCRAFALVAVLWVTALLIIIVTVAAKTVQLDSRLSRAAGENVRGKWALRGGFEKAVAMLNDDPIASDSLNDSWADGEEDEEDDIESDQEEVDRQYSDLWIEGEEEEDLDEIELGKSMLSIKVTDEAGKLNINTATKDQLMLLPNMTTEIVAAIIDWRDTDNEAQNDGAEADYYNSLHYIYNIRNGKFETVRELLLVKGVTEELFFGEDTNLNGKLDYNECDGEERLPIDNGDDVLDKGWIAYLTCYSYDNNKDGQGNKRININEADEKKLTEELEIKKAYAKWIVDNRKHDSIASLINKNTKNEDKNEDSDQAREMDMKTFLEIADKICVNTDERIEGLININTAPKKVLECLLNGDEKLASSIIAYRKSLEGGMESIAELLKMEDMKIDTFKNIANSVTVRSNVFTINCKSTSTVTSALYRGQVVVDRGPDQTKILYWHQEQ